MTDEAPLAYAAAPTSKARSTSAHVDALGTVACVFLALITVGFAAFRFAADALPIGASRNADRTFFTSVNAVTLSGFEQSFASVPNFPTIGRVLLATLAIGGALTTIIGGAHFLRALTGAPVRTRVLVAVATLIVVVPAAVGLIVSGFDGVYAATRLGLSTTGDARRSVAWLVALGVPAVVAPAMWLTRRDGASRAIGATLGVAVALYVASTLVLAVVAGDWPRDLSAAAMANQAARNLNAGSTLAVDASAGVGLNAAWTHRAGATPWATLALMAIGTVPGGVGAGVGLLPLVIVGRRAWSRTSIDAVEDALLGPAVLSIAAWVAVAFATLLVLAATQPAAPGDRLLFIVVSATSNVGLSHDPIDLTSHGLFVLSLAMLAGRMLPIATLCAMAIAADRARASRESVS